MIALEHKNQEVLPQRVRMVFLTLSKRKTGFGAGFVETDVVGLVFVVDPLQL